MGISDWSSYVCSSDLGSETTMASEKGQGDGKGHPSDLLVSGLYDVCVCVCLYFPSSGREAAQVPLGHRTCWASGSILRYRYMFWWVSQRLPPGISETRRVVKVCDSTYISRWSS